MRLDAGIHDRLGIARLVALVVTEAAEPDEVEHNIFVKFTAVIERDLNHAIRRFRVVAVDMKHRRLCNVRRVG